MRKHRRTRALTAATILSLIASSAIAQSPQKPPQPCASEDYRQFDFWLGVWTVTTPDGKPAGENRISARENGCLILEEWTSVSGGTGQSYNFFDPGTNKWRQIWVSAGAVIDYAGGLNEAGEMVLEGEIRYHNGTTAPFKGVWTPNQDGTVRQHFEQFDADKKQWAPWFTGVYRKASKK